MWGFLERDPIPINQSRQTNSSGNLPEVFALTSCRHNLNGLGNVIVPEAISGSFTFFPFNATSTSAPVVPTFPNTFLSSMAEAEVIRFPTT